MSKARSKLKIGAVVVLSVVGALSANAAGEAGRTGAKATGEMGAIQSEIARDGDPDGALAARFGEVEAERDEVNARLDGAVEHCVGVKQRRETLANLPDEVRVRNRRHRRVLCAARRHSKGAPRDGVPRAHRARHGRVPGERARGAMQL